MNTIKIIFSILLFISGLYFYVIYKNNTNSLIENFTSKNDKFRCPNLLIQKDSKFYLYNTKLVNVPGVNPVVFNSLEDYKNFLKWQQNSGIRCPILYLQNSFDTQGNEIYKLRPSVTDPKGGLPPSHITNVTNNNDNNNIQDTTQHIPYLSYKSNTIDKIDTKLDTKYMQSSNLQDKQDIENIEQTLNTKYIDSDNDIYKYSEVIQKYLKNYSDNLSKRTNQYTLLVDSTRNDPPYNTGSYPAHDPSTYYMGKITPLDSLKIPEFNMLYSDNSIESWKNTKYV
jgi:hypothetical protein